MGREGGRGGADRRRKGREGGREGGGLSHGFYSAWDSAALVLEVQQASRGTHPIHCKNHGTTITCTQVLSYTSYQ